LKFGHSSILFNALRLNVALSRIWRSQYKTITGAPPPKGVTDFETSIQSLTGTPSNDGETNREKARQRFAEKLRSKRK
jgi:hypothetical protein